MAVNLLVTSKKLVKALNSRGAKITITTKQFIGKDDKPHNFFSVNKSILNDETGRYKQVELFGTYSMVQLVLFLRDLWFELNGWELPTDQAKWNLIREKLKEEGKHGQYRP